MPRRLVLFAHFDAQGEVKRYIQHYLRALREVSSKIVFVTTASLDEHSRAVAHELADEVLERPNVGFDFCMWRDALKMTESQGWDEILLTNSSVFGPLFPLAKAFEEMSTQDVDVWGMTENLEIAWHLQSYFLVLRNKVLESAAWPQFWSSVLSYRDKWQIVLSYEIGLTRWLQDNGFRLASYAMTRLPPVPETGSRKDRFAGLRTSKANPTAIHPTQLVQVGMPFVKVETLRENHYCLDLAPLRREMNAAGFDSSLLEYDRPVVERAPRPRRTFWQKLRRLRLA